MNSSVDLIQPINHHCHYDFSKTVEVKNIFHYLLSLICNSTKDDVGKISVYSELDIASYIFDNIYFIRYTSYYKIFMGLLRISNIELVDAYSIIELKKWMNDEKNIEKYVSYFLFNLTISEDQQTKYSNVKTVHYIDTYYSKFYVDKHLKINREIKFGDFVEAIYSKLDSQKTLVGIKMGHAYNRKVEIKGYKISDYSTYTLAELCNYDNFEDLVINSILIYANNRNLPVQVHCGMLETSATNKNYVTDTNSQFLSEIVQYYPNVNFVILHSSFPYTDEAITFVLMNKNAFLDLSWMSFYNMDTYAKTLEKSILMLPINKIIGFGCDTSSPILSYVIYENTLEMVKKIKLDLEINDNIEKDIFNKNILKIYKLEKNES